MSWTLSTVWAMLLVCTVVGSALFGGIAEAASNQTKAKKYLNSATKDCKKVMDTIDSSWYFQVYEDYSGKSVIYNYALSVGISQSKVKKIIKKKYGKTDWAGQAACVQVLSYNLGIVHTYYSDKGTFKKIKKNLAKAKKCIKTLSGSKKRKYIKYYNAVNKYYKFVNNPSGSYSGLESKRESLESKVDDAKDALSW